MRPALLVALLAFLLIPACGKRGGERSQSADKTGPDKASPSPAGPLAAGGEMPASQNSSSGSLEQEILGDWKGIQGDSTVEIKFTDKLAVVSILDNRGGFSIGSMGYEVDSGRERVKILGAEDGPAVAQPTKDGALLLWGPFKMGNAIFRLPETRLERAKPGSSPKTGGKTTVDAQGKADTPPSTKTEAEAPDSGKVYRSPTELLADMPKSAYPKPGPEGGIEQAAARKWMKKNLVGRTVEWTATLREIAISGDDPFTVKMWFTDFKDPLEVHAIFHPDLPEGGLLCGFSFGGPFSLGGESCEVILGGKGIVGLSGLRIGYAECTADEAALFRKLKGKKVLIRSKILSAHVSSGKITSAGELKERVPIGLVVSLPSVNGILPQSRKAADKD